MPQNLALAHRRPSSELTESDLSHSEKIVGKSPHNETEAADCLPGQTLGAMYQEAALNSLSAGCLLLGPDLRLRYFNLAADNLLHHFIGQTMRVGQDFRLLVNEGFSEEFEQYFELALKGETVKTERALLYIEENEKWVRLTFAPARNARRKIFGVSLTMEDITKAKRAENLILKNNQKLKKTNQELEKFVYSVAHDLRSPISNVLGLNYLAKTSKTFDEAHGFLTMVDASLARMDEFVRNILDHSRNSQQQVLGQISIADFIQNLLKEHRLLVLQEGVQINTEIDPNLMWNSDSHRLSVILNNLISNALKYHDPLKEDRWVRISAEIAERGGRPLLRLVVEDNGAGIAAEHLPRLYQMFYTANPQAKGSGIGLSILKDAVVQLKGEVEVDSELGHGTTFSVELPLLANGNEES